MFFIKFNLKEFLSNRKLIIELMTLKNYEDIRKFFINNKIEITDEEINLVIEIILKSIENKDKLLTDNDLENIGSGMVSIVRTTGKVISLPFRSLFYSFGAILASIPKGFVDGCYDSWTYWANIEKDDLEKGNIQKK